MLRFLAVRLDDAIVLLAFVVARLGCLVLVQFVVDQLCKLFTIHVIERDVDVIALLAQ